MVLMTNNFYLLFVKCGATTDNQRQIKLFDRKMGLNKKEIKSATAASQIQFAISLLHAATIKLIKSHMPKDIARLYNNDFAKTLQSILQTIEESPDRSDVGIASLRENIKRACRIRHRYSHQNFDIRRFEEDMECLKNIATMIKAHDVVDEIDKFIKITSGK